MRAAMQHEVSHDAKKKKKTFLPRVQHIRRWPPTSAGKTRCLPVIILIILRIQIILTILTILIMLIILKN